MPVTRTQMWSDLLGAGVDKTEIDRKPNAYLLELWKQLQTDQHFLLPQKKKAVRRKPGDVTQEAHPVRLEDHLAVPASQEGMDILWAFE